MEYKSPKELGPLDELERTPHRPLGQLSNFVVEDLPDLIANKDLQSIFSASEGLAHELDEIPNDRTAHLDLMFLATAIETLGGRTGVVLESIISKNFGATAAPMNLTYEDLIIGMPHDTDPRTFHPGEIGETERYFYRLHRSIEDRMALIIQALETGLLSPDQMREQLETVAVPGMRDVNAQMEAMREDLNGYLFNKFRPFFRERNGIPGASGKYSGGTLTIDTLVAGNDPKLQAKLECKRDELIAYPASSIEQDGVAGHRDIIQARTYAERGETLLEMDRLDVADGRQAIVEELSRFRNQHYRLVGKFLKDIMQGTAGEIIAPFLRGFSIPFQLLKKQLK